MTARPGAVAFDYLGGAVSEKLELARLASGALFVSADDPPLLVIHGDADKQVLIDQSERIVLAYRKIGLEAKFIVVPGGVHAGPRYFTGKISDSVVRFLHQRIKVSPASDL
jgi:dipeptidyl aminopeptidase/acylaminoacyl peptidase